MEVRREVKVVAAWVMVTVKVKKLNPWVRAGAKVEAWVIVRMVASEGDGEGDGVR